MALELVWTERAIKGYGNVIEYLENRWTEKEVSNFVRESNRFFELLKKYPRMLEPSTKQANVHRGPINRHTMLTYRVRPRKKQVELLNIYFAKQNIAKA